MNLGRRGGEAKKKVKEGEKEKFPQYVNAPVIDPFPSEPLPKRENVRRSVARAAAHAQGQNRGADQRLFPFGSFPLKWYKRRKLHTVFKNYSSFFSLSAKWNEKKETLYQNQRKGELIQFVLCFFYSK